MLKEAESFWTSIAGKVRRLIQSETQNTFRCERYDVTTAPADGKIGVTLPLGQTEIFIPYSAEVESATVGDTVLVVWWGSMSNAKAYYFGNGYAGASGGGGGSDVLLGTISTNTTWTQQTDDWTQTVTVSGATVTENSKVDLQPDTTVLAQMISDGTSAMYIENNAGTLTAHAIGTAPSVALTVQCTITEVEP